jgi:hypothetical protein
LLVIEEITAKLYSERRQTRSRMGRSACCLLL